MDNSDKIKAILTDIGYDLHDYGKEYRSRPIYRDSDNNTVLRIMKDTGRWVDFKEGISGSLEELVRLSLNLSSTKDAKEYLDSKIDLSSIKASKPLVSKVKILPTKFLDKIKKNNSYWNRRGISNETLNLFEGGICESGKMIGRYIFPVYNSRRKLIGVSGRDIYQNFRSNRPKWKHIGHKMNWQYPLQVNGDILLAEKKIILIESIGDMLSLWEAGVKNTLVTFGLDVPSAVLSSLLRFDPNEVIVSLNNDKDQNFAGNKAAKKAKNKLLLHFDDNQIKICLPTKNDFGEMNRDEILDWYEKI